MAQGVHGVSGPLPARHRYLRARALALRAGARGVGARLARRPAARGGRAHRVPERRAAFRVEEVMRRALLFGFLSTVTGAQACDLPGGEAKKIEAPNCLVLYRTKPAPLKVGQHFA